MAQDKDKGVVEFNAEAGYAAKIAAAKAGKVPLGGTAMPPVPRFDQAPPDRYAGVQAARPSVHQVLPQQQREQLAQSGQMIPGVGSAYAANQPAAQASVNVPQQAMQPQAPQAPQGDYINPPRPEGSGLRPETVQQLEAVAKANKTKDEEDKEFLPTEDDLDGYETDEFGNRVKHLLNNRKRRDDVESRCAPLQFEDLITLGEVRQRVPIIPGKLEPTYRSSNGSEDLFIKKILGQERGSETYMLDMFSLMNLTIGLHALNGRDLPSHLVGGDIDEKAFREKMKTVAKMPMALLADLSVNYIWFSRRLQKLFVADTIKGF